MRSPTPDLVQPLIADKTILLTVNKYMRFQVGKNFYSVLREINCAVFDQNSNRLHGLV